MTAPVARNARTALIALSATLAIQIFTSLAATAPAVLAPELALEFDVNPKWIGVFVGVTYAGAMLASLASIVFIERYGAIRVSQVGVLLCATGITLVGVLPPGAVGALAGAAILLGLGYGPITPASSQVLSRTTPPSQMALMFSIKQTGVPAGVALAGVLLPAAAVTLGWRAAAIAVGLLGVVVAASAQSTRRALDTDLHAARTSAFAGIVGRLRLVARTPALAELAMLSFAYASVQVCLTSFLVVYLHDVLHWSLVAAGLALTFATVGGVIGRIGWGTLADRALAPRRVLSLIGLIAGACSLAMAFSTEAWPAGVVLTLAAIFGGTAIGWNGVQLSELARLAPPGSAGAVTGASGFITFAGVVTGPPLFAAMAAITASYRTGYIVFAVVSFVAAAMLYLRPRRA
jgi:MFS family permease